MPDTKEQATPTPKTDAVCESLKILPNWRYYPAMLTHARQLETELAEANAINTHRRLFDLVRYQRAELHGADLITDDEYDWLYGHEFSEDKGKLGSPSPRRLEDYDEMRQRLAAMEEALKELHDAWDSQDVGEFQIIFEKSRSLAARLQQREGGK